MAFKLERFDILKQNYDKTGLFFYHDTVGTAGDGNALATIVADDFFNGVVDELAEVGAIIFVSAVDGAGVYTVTQLYDENGEVEVKVTTAAGGLSGAGKAANQAASTAVDVAGLKTDFNALLTKLKNAKLMAADA